MTTMRERELRAELERYKDRARGAVALAVACACASLLPALVLMWRHVLALRELDALRLLQPVHARMLAEPGALGPDASAARCGAPALGEAGRLFAAWWLWCARGAARARRAPPRPVARDDAEAPASLPQGTRSRCRSTSRSSSRAARARRSSSAGSKPTSRGSFGARARAPRGNARERPRRGRSARARRRAPARRSPLVSRARSSGAEYIYAKEWLSWRSFRIHI